MKAPSFEPIGILETCFVEKFGAPRQSGMIPAARGILKLKPDPAYRDAVRHLETFSHVWIIFHFHDLLDSAWKPLISPPRIDAPGRIGLFASRSPHRPNALGMSAVKLERIDLEAAGGIEIHLSGIDVLDGTPVYDLKPYVPYVDCIPSASAGWTASEIPKFEVRFSDKSLKQLENFKRDKVGPEDLAILITQTMEYDPRPTSQRKALPLSEPKNDGLQFAFRIAAFDIHWSIQEQGLLINSIDQLMS